MRILHNGGKLPDLTKVVSKDASRPVLTQAHLDTERAVIEATDSYRLASIPVEVEEGDVSGLIPAEALAAFTKAHKRSMPQPSLQCGEAEIVLEVAGNRQTWKREQNGTFPNIPQLIPDEHRRSGFRIGINAQMLADLAKGLGSDNGHVELTFVMGNDKVEGEDTGYFCSNLRPFLVSAPSNRDAVGLIMPVRVP